MAWMFADIRSQTCFMYSKENDHLLNLNTTTCTITVKLIFYIALWQTYLHTGAPAVWLPYTSIDQLLTALDEVQTEPHYTDVSIKRMVKERAWYFLIKTIAYIESAKLWITGTLGWKWTYHETWNDTDV